MSASRLRQCKCGHSSHVTVHNIVQCAQKNALSARTMCVCGEETMSGSCINFHKFKVSAYLICTSLLFKGKKVAVGVGGGDKGGWFGNREGRKD